MKSFFLVLLFSLSASAKCPDFSGQYESTNQVAGALPQKHKLVQTGCEQLDWYSSFRDESGIEEMIKVREIHITFGYSYGLWNWGSDTTFYKDDNTFGNPTRTVIEMLPNGDIQKKWRFDSSSADPKPWNTTNYLKK